MAITLQNKDPNKGWSTMALFGVSTGLVHKAKQNGNIQVVQTQLGEFAVKNSFGLTFATIQINPTSLSLAQKKSMGPDSVLKYRHQFEEGLQKALAGTPSKDHKHEQLKAILGTPGKLTAAVEAEDEDEYTAEAKAKAALPKVTAVQMPKPKAAQTSAVDSKPVLKLSEATALYQPVKGTDPGSVYYTFALFPGLNLAAKVQGTKLHIRAEGANLKQYAPLLKEYFKMDNSVTHVSIHTDAGSEGFPLMVKGLGALIGAIGFEKAEKVANLTKFIKELAA